jgi:hypothetical protein
MKRKIIKVLIDDQVCGRCSAGSHCGHQHVLFEEVTVTIFSKRKKYFVTMFFKRLDHIQKEIDCNEKLIPHYKKEAKNQPTPGKNVRWGDIGPKEMLKHCQDEAEKYRNIVSELEKKSHLIEKHECDGDPVGTISIYFRGRINQARKERYLREVLIANDLLDQKTLVEFKWRAREFYF